MRRLLALAAFGFAAGAAAQSPAAANRPIAIVGGTVHVVSGPDVAGGTVLLRNGKIEAVGAGIAVPADAVVVDAKGKHVYPSLLPPLTVLGLVEISAVHSTVDTTEVDEINPQARADFAINFDSELLPVARSGGVLVAGVAPLGGLISGSVAVVKLDGWTREDADVRAPAAIVVAWPDLRIDRSPTARFSARLQERRRDDAVEKLKTAFADARAYARARSAEGQGGVPRHDFDPRLEALGPALEGKIPVVVKARTVAQIRAALAWAKQEKLKLVLADCEDGWRMADEIAKAQVPVIVAQPLELPRRQDEAYDTNFANAGELARAGVTVVFSDGDTGMGASNVRNLPHQVATAVTFGFPREKALEAITLGPARLLGVDGRLGSIAPGKDATLFLADGDIFDLRSGVTAAWIEGRPLDLTDKQKRLYERYRNRPKK